MKGLRDAEHLLRVAGVCLLGVLGFAAARAYFVPHSFGQYGHYRGDSIAEIAARPIVHAGHETCEGCHSDVFETKKAGKHARVACEACHGPQARHAQLDDPSSAKPPRPDTVVLCVRCHEANPAKPPKFPQVVSKEHSGGMACGECHKAHTPAMPKEVKK
jgi:hypothetical protein